MKVNLFINWYIDKHPQRRHELVSCLLDNFRNPSIDRIIVAVSGNDLENLNNVLNINGLKKNQIDKLIVNIRGDRPTYNDYFTWTREYVSDINIISNTDIVMEERSLELLKKWNFGRHCLALSRWDYIYDNMNVQHTSHHDHKDSQDTWIVKGGFPNIPKADFPLGKKGCDNRIAHELSKFYMVINPSQSIRTFHYHLTGLHNYAPHGDNRDLIPPPYKMVLIQKLPL